MQIKVVIFLLSLTLFAGVPHAEQAKASSQGHDQTSLIPGGMSPIDLDGDGVDEIVVKAWRDNFNAHGFYVVSFYKEDENKRLNIIPVEQDDGGFSEILRLYPAAECWISDIRVDPDFLTLYQKTDYKTIQDKSRVNAYFYKLKENKEGIPGLPEWYFEKKYKVQSKGEYCDVREAIEAEIFNK
ncbi:MAG: hypothetical protein KDI46_01705 [Alphaproteobacteria bacterium]|nr:hypothetical protein [Alphaproteobacteria bacterium]